MYLAKNVHGCVRSGRRQRGKEGAVLLAGVEDAECAECSEVAQAPTGRVTWCSRSTVQYYYTTLEYCVYVPTQSSGHTG